MPSGTPEGIDEWHAAFAYDGVARSLVAGVKYRRTHAATAWLADAMAPLVTPPVPPLVTWAPTTALRRRARGYDHAELLARQLARRIHRPCRGTLRRCDGPPQTGLPAVARRRGPRFAAHRHVPSAVVIVDDVATTGATLAAAAAVLRRSGAQRVVALTAARTPPP
jgi:predicted amidophosphoribosyltransferase